MNPEQIKQEQERVKGLLEGHEKAEAAFQHAETAYWLKNGRTIGGSYPLALHLLTQEALDRYDDLQNESRPLARAYLALLDAHLALHAQLAQAEGREAALREERDAYRKGLTTLINVHVNVPSAGDMRDVWERNAWKHAESIVAQYGCESCAGLTFEDGIIACWTCGRVLPDAQAGEG